MKTWKMVIRMVVFVGKTGYMCIYVRHARFVLTATSVVFLS